MTAALDTLRYFVAEREKIRVLKEAGNPPPWTSDPILAKYRFCSVRRSDDRVSVWLRQNVLLQKHIDFDLKSFLLFSALCRWINWPPTIKAIMDAKLYPRKRLDFKRIGKVIDTLAKTEKAWTGAYMIRAPKKKGGKKGRFVAEQVVGKSLKDALPSVIRVLARGDSDRQLTYSGAWEALREVPNYGSFMAGQVAGDWTYTSLLSGAEDLDTWAPMGPGSVRGFNRLMGNEKLGKRPSEELWLEKLQEWRAIIVDVVGPLDMLSVQNCLCEYDKWDRVRTNQGRPRAKYVAHTY